MRSVEFVFWEKDLTLLTLVIGICGVFRLDQYSVDCGEDIVSFAELKK